MFKFHLLFSNEVVSGVLINRTSHSVVLSEAADITEKRMLTVASVRRCTGLSIPVPSLLNINTGAGCPALTKPATAA